MYSNLKVFLLILAICFSMTASNAQYNDHGKRPVHTPLIIKGDYAFPPYEFIGKNGEPEGFNVDIIKAIMKELDIPYKLTLEPWNKVIKEYKEGKVDLLTALIYSSERSKTMNFGPIFDSMPMVAVYRKGASPINKVSDLKDKVIGIESDAIAHELLKNMGYDKKTITMNSIENVLRLLSEGYFEVVMCDFVTAKTIIKKQGYDNLEISNLGFPPQEYRLAGANDSLINKINQVYYKLEKNGVVDKLHNKWLKKDNLISIPKWMYLTIIILIVALSLLFILNRILKRKINNARIDVERQNRRLSLAINAGNLLVWGYSTSQDRFYVIEGEIISGRKKSLSETLELIDENYRQQMTETFNALKKGIIPQEPLITHIYRESMKQWRYIRTMFALINNDEGNVDTIIGAEKDITEEMQSKTRMETLLDKYYALFNATSVGLEHFDANGILTDMNDAALNLMQIKDKQKRMDAHISIFDNEILAAHIDKDNPQPYHGIIEYNKEIIHNSSYFKDSNLKDEKSMDLHINPIYNKEKKLESIILSFTDVTEKQKLQRLLHESIQKMEFAIKSAKLVYWEYDCKSRHFTSLNESLNENSETQLYMDTLYNYTHPSDFFIIQEYASLFDKGEDTGSRTWQLRMRKPGEKEWRYYTFSGIPFEKDPHTGRVTKYVGFRSDITENAKLSMEVRDYAHKMQYVLDSSGTVAWSYDISTKMIHDNSGNPDVNQLRTVENYLERVDPEEREKAKEIFDLMDKKELGNFSNQRKFMPMQSKLYSQYYIINGVPVKDENGEIKHYFGLCRNITDLINIQHSLEQEKEKAQLADKLKSAFLANMSHEIRTPLNSIVGFSSLLQTVDSPKEKEDYVQIINSNSDHLLRLINDILDLSKIESGIINLQYERFDVVPLFKQLCKTLSQRVKDKKIQFIIDSPEEQCFIKFDKSRLSQLYTNFIINATKYTAEGYIKAGYSLMNNGLRIYVEDSGIGIAENKQNRIFHRFEKLDEFAQGTGLGLSICKAITDSCNGKIGFQSEEGKGSTFWAWIPSEPN